MTWALRSLGPIAILIAASLPGAGHVLAQSGTQAPPSPAASLVPGAVNVLIAVSWNTPDPNGMDVEWSTGSFTVRGALPIDWLLVASPEDGEQLGAPWPASGTQQHGWYDASTCAGDVLVDCGTCTMDWVSQWDEDPRLTIVDADEGTVGVDDWSTVDPDPTDEQFVQGGCDGIGTTDFGRGGLGHVELDVTFDGDAPVAVAIQPGIDSGTGERFVDPDVTMSVQLLQ